MIYESWWCIIHNFNIVEWSFIIKFLLVKINIFINLRNNIYFHSDCNSFTRNSISVYYVEQYYMNFLFFLNHDSYYIFIDFEILYICIRLLITWICLLWKLASHQYLYLVLFLFVINLIISVQLCFWNLYFLIECTLWWKLKVITCCCVSYDLLAHLLWSPVVCISFYILSKLLKNVNQTQHTASLVEGLSR